MKIIICDCGYVCKAPVEDGLYSCYCGKLTVDNRQQGMMTIMGNGKWKLAKARRGAEEMPDYYTVHHTYNAHKKTERLIAIRYRRA